MTFFEELDLMFTNHTHYYIVGTSSMNEALDRCARVAGGTAQVVNYKGQMILASQMALGDQIPWLTEVPRPDVATITETIPE